MAIARQRMVLPAAAVACVLLVPVEFGWVPPVRYAWSFNLWQYLHVAVAAALAGSLLLLCWSVPRSVALRALRGLSTRAAGARLGWLGFLAAPVVLWLLRERKLYGDSHILLYNAAVGPEFIFPDVGASTLFHLAFAVSQRLGVHPTDGTQLLICACGGVAIACFARFCRLLAPSGGRAALACALIVSGGLLRVLAGHVEVYAFLLMCAGAYLWAAFAYLRGRCGYVLPSLALGVGVWMHASFLFLIPSLVVLPVLVAPGRTRDWMRAWLRGIVMGAAPSLLFYLVMFALGNHAALEHAWAKALEWSGMVPSSVGFESLLRFWWRPAGSGTKYVIYSWPHLKYLVNAFFLLAPTTLPVLFGFAIFSARRFVSSREAVFLTTASGFLLVYASLVRPFWGPYDWDLFSLTAVFLACLAAYLLVNWHGAPRLSQLGALLVGASLCLVTVPFLIIGISPARAAGPFADRPLAPTETETLIEVFERQLGPWL